MALLALGTGEPSKLAHEMGLSRPATSRQLQLLYRTGLISVRRGWVDRRRAVYYIEPSKLGQITAWLAGTEVGRAFPLDAPANASGTSDSSAYADGSAIGHADGSGIGHADGFGTGPADRISTSSDAIRRSR